jgi:hypothetical protein
MRETMSMTRLLKRLAIAVYAQAIGNFIRDSATPPSMHPAPPR